MATDAQPQADLLQQGASSYLDALAAVEAFRRRVKSICWQAYERHDYDLKKWVGIGKSECELWDDPYPDERCADLGIRLPAGTGTSGFYVYLQWTEDVDGVSEVMAAMISTVYRRPLTSGLRFC